MKVLPPSQRAIDTIANQGWLNVWEGSVRSSKTVISSLAWLYYISTVPDKYFLMTGKTIGSLIRNVFESEAGLCTLVNTYRQKNSAGTYYDIATPMGVKRCYCFGGGESDSHKSLVGLTVAGWYADEVSEHHPRFVQECFNRTIVSSSSRRHFWTLNPQSPHHYIYKDYLDRYDAMTPEENQRAGGYYWHHFTLQDNPALSKSDIEAIATQYSGYAYERYILGRRVIAEGLVYPTIGSEYFEDFDRSRVDIKYCALDFGASHATAWYLGGPLLDRRGNKIRDEWRICYEYYDQDSGKDTMDYAEDFISMCESIGINPRSVTVAVDPAAKVMALSLQKKGIPVMKAVNDVIPGITAVDMLTRKGSLKYHSSCKYAQDGFATYSWDPKAQSDKPIKSDDDAMDAIRYFVASHMRHLLTS